MEGVTATLLIGCPDRSGIVAAVSTFIAERGGNVLAADQHVDSETNAFFMRVVWDLAGFQIPRDKVAGAVMEFAARERIDHQLWFSDARPRVAIFASKTPHCLYDLLLNAQLNELGGDVAVVVSNHPNLQSVAEHFSVPFVYVPMKDRAHGEAEQRRILAEHRVDLVVLARYMQILSPQFVADWEGRIINIHHSFLPAFIGAEAYRQAKERGVKMIGATAHFVTSELDQGPIIEQETVRVSHRDSLKDLMRKGRELERHCLSRAVRLHLERKVLVAGNRTVVFD